MDHEVFSGIGLELVLAMTSGVFLIGDKGDGGEADNELGREQQTNNLGYLYC